MARGDSREEGQSLVEVLVALSVLMVVLVPALFLVTGSTKVVYNNQFEVAAANLANGQLETDRNQVVALQTLPPPPPTSPVTVGSESYTITQQTGWCSAPTSSRQWGVYTLGAPYAYAVLVTVTWNQQHPMEVQVSGVLTTPVGAAPSGACPL